MELSHNQACNKEDIAWKFVNRVEDSKWRCHHCSGEFFGDLTGVKGHLLGVPNEGISICMKVPDYIRTILRLLLDGVAEEESRKANRQFSMEPQSHDMPSSLPPDIYEYAENSPMTPQGATDSLQDIIGLKSDQLSPAVQSSFHQNSTPLSLVQNSHDESPLCSMGALLEEALDFDSPIYDRQTPAGASSSQYDQFPAIGNAINMNRGSPNMKVRSIYANDEGIRNLKRKVEELDNKQDVIKEQMEVESAASSVRKKPKTSVERWLRETVRARNNFRIIGQANAETFPPKEQVETLTREVEELIGKLLPQTLLIEERDARGLKFLEREPTGEAIRRDIEFIWDCLKANCACKLGIYGMGGVGKTTIMMNIHNRLLEDATFDGVLFITVSQDFSIYKLQSDIWKALKFGVMEDEHVKKRAAMLLEQLERKKNCVLILDDVWERLDLEEVGIPIRANGFKLVLTTRSFDVCCQMQCQEKMKIEPLSQEEAESLFLEEFGSEVSLNLEIKAVVKSIVEECEGLPLGVITMARSMRGVTNVFEWRESLEKLKESSKWQTDKEKVLMNLKSSYDCLGNPDVQQCFLSCALYPKDELIDKFELVEFFIDQGLIGELNTRNKEYDRGLTILNTLENVCLLEDDEGRMKMHNLIRHMALHIISAMSIVKAGKRLRRIPPEEYWKDALEKVSLMANEISEFPLNMSPNCPKLSTLLLNRSFLKDVAIPDSFFKRLCALKVLNLSGCELRELPNSISDLVNLRALLLRECRKLRRIPYLGKLTSLRKLDAGGCGSLEVLEGVEKLVNLRSLDLTDTRIEKLPEGTLDHLLNLQCLKVQAVNEEDIRKLGALEAFRCYCENVDDFSKFVRVIKQSDKPRCYDLNVSLEKSEFIVEVSDDARFGNLGRSLYIREWGHAIVSVGRECSSNFILIPHNVQVLGATNCDGITNLLGMGPLECLEELEIEKWKNLRVLCGEQDKEVIDIDDSPAPTPTPLLFPNLRVLQIDGCPKLKYLFGHGSKFNLPHLEEIQIFECKEMMGIIAAVPSPPPHLPSAFPSLQAISVGYCDKMKRAVESEWMPHFPNLSRITVLNCKNMEEIIRGPPPPRVPVIEISLEFLVVKDCSNMRKLFSHEWLSHLQKLRSIEVECCEGMVEKISGVGQGQEGSIMTPVNLCCTDMLHVLPCCVRHVSEHVGHIDTLGHARTRVDRVSDLSTRFDKRVQKTMEGGDWRQGRGSEDEAASDGEPATASRTSPQVKVPQGESISPPLLPASASSTHLPGGGASPSQSLWWRRWRWWWWWGGAPSSCLTPEPAARPN